jgi:hypothetical protein
LSALMFLFRPSNTTRMKRNRKDEKLVWKKQTNFSSRLELFNEFLIGKTC